MTRRVPAVLLLALALWVVVAFGGGPCIYEGPLVPPMGARP